MSAGYYYNLCQKHRGKAVEIRTRDGRVHRGIIERVGNNRVYMRPLGQNRNFGGYGYGYYGGWGFGFGIAIGAIVGLSLLSFLWW